MHLCTIAELQRSSFYKWRKRKTRPLTQKELEDEELKRLLKEIDQEVKHIYGCPRLTLELNARYHKPINHKRVYRLKKELNIQAKIFKKKRKFKHEEQVAENVLKRDFSADNPDKKYVTDITYLTGGRTRLYLSTILDACTKEVVAYQLSEVNDNKLVLDTLKKLNKKRDVKNALIHSDQGHQYTSHKYTNQLKKYHMIKSMSRKANCWDNALMESFFGKLKEESIRILKPQTKREIRKVIKNYIEFYNNRRRQKKLNGMTPLEYKNAIAA